MKLAIILKKGFIYLVFMILLISLTGCRRNDEEKMKEKIIQEINFLDDLIVSMLNELNNISLDNFSIIYNKIELSKETNDSSSSQSTGSSSKNESISGNNEGNNLITTEIKTKTMLGSDNEDINWNLIEEQIEILDTSWNVILLDLYNSNPQDTDVVGFSDKLNDTILSIKDRDKSLSLINLRDLYSYIPKFLELAKINDENQKIKQAKLCLINSYIYANEENWENVKKELLNCELQINNISNKKDYVENREYKVNKMFILVKEIEKTTSIQDKTIFFMKYKNLLQSINSI